MKNSGMNFVDAPMPEITPGATSYFSAPSQELDSRLFQGTHLQSWVRSGVLGLLFEHLALNYSNPHTWAKVWLAGSGVSYQWEAAREPGDLDCLVGVDYVTFRRSNPEFVALSDQEIASTFNERFNAELTPTTRNWEGYELTFYVNPQSDIRDINPYAAYDLVGDFWTVEPDQNPQPPYSRDWEQRTERDRANAQELLNRYNSALREVRSATNPAHRINADRKLQLATEQVSNFYDDIHAGRKIAFSKIGGGYSDYNNYRWQAGKRSGAVQALRTIKEYKTATTLKEQQEKYGVELPDADTLLRRSIRGS
jgi:hypothetical protein